MIGPGRVLDAYSIRARWSPILLVVLPPLLLCFSLIPGLPASNKLWPLLAAAGVVVLADQLGRDAGKRLQQSLWSAGAARRRLPRSATVMPRTLCCSHASTSG